MTSEANALHPGCVGLWMCNAQGAAYQDQCGQATVWWVGPPHSVRPETYDTSMRVAHGGARPATRRLVQQLAAFVHGWQGMTALDGPPVECTPPQVMSVLFLAPHWREQLTRLIEQMERDGMVPPGVLTHG